MAATILIGAILLLYAAYVIWRKVKDFKAGKYCSCSCGSCSRGCTKAADGAEEKPAGDK